MTEEEKKKKKKELNRYKHPNRTRPGKEPPTEKDKLDAIDLYCKNGSLRAIAIQLGLSYGTISNWYEKSLPVDWDQERERRTRMVLDKQAVAWAKQQKSLQNVRIKGANVIMSKPESLVSTDEALRMIELACDKERALYEPSQTVRRGFLGQSTTPGGGNNMFAMMEEIFNESNPKELENGSEDPNEKA